MSFVLQYKTDLNTLAKIDISERFQKQYKIGYSRHVQFKQFEDKTFVEWSSVVIN